MDLAPEAVGAADVVRQTISRRFCDWGLVIAGGKEEPLCGRVGVGVTKVTHPGYSLVLKVIAASVEGAAHVE